MKLTDSSLKNPHLILIICAAVSLTGLYALFFMPTDLFPDTVPPQVVVITSWPGASRQEVENNITRLLEPELQSARRLKEISSISRDEVSSISLEFDYDRNSEAAATEITNILERIRGQLPDGSRAPQIHRITNVTSPVMTVALSPAENSIKNLRDIKLLAANDIRNLLLNVEGVNEVEVFGGFEPEVSIAISRQNLESYNLSLPEILSALAAENISLPGGYINSNGREYIIKSERVFRNLEDVKNTVIARRDSSLIRISDLAEINYGHDENRSFYRGNGKRAIALNILRGEDDAAVTTIENSKNKIEELRRQFGDINFEITADQAPIINVNIRGMNWSLVSAVIMTCIVVFFFLAEWRPSLVMAVAIPLSFFASLSLLNFTPWTLDMVTLSGLIISTGMVVDAAVIVVENIMRHFDSGEISLGEAVKTGAGEVAVDIFAGMMTTVIVLLPIMFIGGYPQQVLRPLSVVISATLFASWLAAAAVVPLVLKNWLKPNRQRNRFEKTIESGYEKVAYPLQNYYLALSKAGLRHKKKFLFSLLILTVFIVVISVNFVGRELMPPMDSG
ncbi:MAG: efflux RND transporter permease subunit, partial [bacterium]